MKWDSRELCHTHTTAESGWKKTHFSYAVSNTVIFRQHLKIILPTLSESLNSHSTNAMPATDANLFCATALPLLFSAKRVLHTACILLQTFWLKENNKSCLWVSGNVLHVGSKGQRSTDLFHCWLQNYSETAFRLYQPPPLLTPRDHFDGHSSSPRWNPAST